jgi:hypothetical protein
MHAVTAAGSHQGYVLHCKHNTFWYAHIMPKKLKDPETPCLINRNHLYLVENLLLELALDLRTVSLACGCDGSESYLLAGVVLVGLAVKTEESTKIELGCLEELDLSDVDLCRVSLVTPLLIPCIAHTFWRG